MLYAGHDTLLIISALPAPYAANVYFHVYIIANHETYKPDAKQHFDYSKFQQEMEQFRLPRQVCVRECA